MQKNTAKTDSTSSRVSATSRAGQKVGTRTSSLDAPGSAKPESSPNGPSERRNPSVVKMTTQAVGDSEDQLSKSPAAVSRDEMHDTAENTTNESTFENAKDAASFRSAMDDKNKSLYDTLRNECERIEANFHNAECEVLRADDITFLMMRNQAELAELALAQSIEAKNKEESFEKMIAGRQERKEAKRIHRADLRRTKRRDLLILRQQTASQLATSVRIILSQRRQAFDDLIEHMESVHEKSRKQLIAAQDRKMQYEKALNELECQHLPTEMRSTVIKKFAIRQNYQIAVNKRINDQLREIQQVETRQAKEKFELESRCYEERSNLRATHVTRSAEMADSQLVELHAEKERVLARHEKDKLAGMTSRHQQEMKAMARENRIATRQFKLKQEQKYVSEALIVCVCMFESLDVIVIAARKARKNDGSAGGAGPIVIESKNASAMMSSHGSKESLPESTTSRTPSKSASNSGMRSLGVNSAAAFGRGGTAISDIDDESQADVQSVTSSVRGMESINNLRARQHQELNELISQLRQEMNDCDLSIDARLSELEEQHCIEIDKLRTDHAEEIENLIAIQEKEILMEQTIQDAEMKMLVERRVLNSVLQNVVD
eukprot:jgi/Hompol1/6714/HPOL_005053-RA